MLERVEAFIRERDLIEPGGEVTVPRLRRRRLDLPLARARRARLPRLGAPRRARPARRRVGRGRPLLPRGASAPRWSSAPPGATEAELRELRYSFAADRLRATGHTASDQVESVLLGLVASGAPQRIKAKRRGRRRPAAARRLARGDARATATSADFPYREDSSNPDTKRGLIRDEILPLLERLDPRARASLLCARRRASAAAAHARADARRSCSRAATARRPPTSAAASAPCASTTRCGSRARSSWGPWTLEPTGPGSRCAARRPGDRLAGRAEESAGSARGREGAAGGARRLAARRVSGDEVVAVPGVAEAPGWEGAVTWTTVRGCRRRDLDRGGAAAGADRRARRRDLAASTRAATCSSSASSREPSSSWPT